MKTLKQIREEYNSKSSTQVENLPEEVLLEKNVIPSTKEMPSLLIFRRVSFRSYPKGQVVALYYSRTMDKYLSVPIGPGGNINLSESVVTDTLDEACWDNYKQEGMKKKGNKMVPNCVPVEEQGSSATRYTERPTYEEKVASLRAKKMEEGLGDAVSGAIGGYMRGGLKGALKGGLKGLLKSKSDDDKGSSKEKGDFDTADMKSSSEKSKAVARTHSSWENRASSDPVYQSKAKRAAIAPIHENKITDIRAMIKEGIDNMDLSINGRTITLNTSMAKRILEVYDSVNTKNKKIVEGMLNEDLESFKKLLNFSVRN